MGVVVDVRTKFPAKMKSAAVGFVSAHSYEPGSEGIGRLPACTMIYRGARELGAQTGPLDDLEHTWTVRVYVDCKNSWQKAQEQIEDLVGKMLAAIRSDYTLTGASELVRLVDELSEPAPAGVDPERPTMFVKRLRLTAREESV